MIVTMKHSSFYTLFIFCLSLFAMSCGSDDKSVPAGTIQQENIVGNAAQPNWALPADIDMTSSMTAVVNVDLLLTYPEQVADFCSKTGDDQIVNETDILAAFSGEMCVGVAQFIDGLFFLYVTRPLVPQPLTFRYYSAKLHNIFMAENVCDFEPDATKGAVSAPLTPAFRLKDNN